MPKEFCSPEIGSRIASIFDARAGWFLLVRLDQQLTITGTSHQPRRWRRGNFWSSNLKSMLCIMYGDYKSYPGYTTASSFRSSNIESRLQRPFLRSSSAVSFKVTSLSQHNLSFGVVLLSTSCNTSLQITRKAGGQHLGCPIDSPCPGLFLCFHQARLPSSDWPAALRIH